MWFQVKLIDLFCNLFLSLLFSLNFNWIIGNDYWPRNYQTVSKSESQRQYKDGRVPFSTFSRLFFCPILLCVPFCFFWLLDAVALSLLSFDTCVSSDAKKRLARLKFAAPMTLITLSLPHHYQHIIRLHLQANGDRMLTLSTIHRPTIHSLPFENVAQLNY